MKKQIKSFELYVNRETRFERILKIINKGFAIVVVTLMLIMIISATIKLVKTSSEKSKTEVLNGSSSTFRK